MASQSRCRTLKIETTLKAGLNPQSPQIFFFSRVGVDANALASMSSSSSSCSSSFCWMKNLAKSWDEETIALLLNKTLVHAKKDDDTTAPLSSGSIRISSLQKQRNPEFDDANEFVYRLEFPSKKERDDTIHNYGGLSIPMTHGYHYYDFWVEEQDGSGGEDDDCDSTGRSNSPPHSGIRYCYPSPPLHLQLMALTSDELKKRIEACRKKEEDLDPISSPLRPSDKVFLLSDETKSTSSNKSKKHRHRRRNCRVRNHALLVAKLLTVKLSSEFLQGRSSVVHCSGAALPSQHIQLLLGRLRSLPDYCWPTANRQRKGVLAGKYLTVRRKKQSTRGSKNRAKEVDDLWDLCASLIRLVVPDVEYTALAITKNFHGSPHVDLHDTTFQHVLAVGDFTGGELCADDGLEQDISIDVHNRLGRIDGRGVHWVAGWHGTDRYSIVYYSTDPANYTNPLPPSQHLEWMSKHQTEPCCEGERDIVALCE